MENCKKCNEPVSGNYCSNCGQPAKLERIDRRYLIREIRAVFYADKGFLYTLKKLLTRPGESINSYITEDRSRYVKPVTFVFVTSLIYTFAKFALSLEFDGYIPVISKRLESYNLIMRWVENNTGYAELIFGFFIGLCLKLFFKKSGKNVFECFVLLCFVSGIWMMIDFIFVFFKVLLPHWNVMIISNCIAMIYFIWAVGQFFGKKQVKNYLKAFLAFATGIMIFTLLIMVVFVIELLVKH